MIHVFAPAPIGYGRLVQFSVAIDRRGTSILHMRWKIK